MSSESRPQVSVLVTDLDNTLWDWFAIWYACFSALLSKLVELSGVDRARLENEIRTIHQQRGTSEYSHLIQEIPSLVQKDPESDLTVIYDEAISAYRIARKSVMHPYPGVFEALEQIRAKGTRIVAYTESQAYYTSYRLRSFGFDGLIDVLYSPADHDFPHGVTHEQMRTLPSDHYGLHKTKTRHTPPGVLKPEPSVLDAIVQELGVSPASVAYVGDSLMKDVAMAQSVGVIDVHAKYGEVQNLPEYGLLQRVSHWTQEDVDREIAISKFPHVSPSFVLSLGFADLLSIFDFCQHE